MIDPQATTVPARRAGTRAGPTYEVKPADPEAERNQALAAWHEGSLGGNQLPQAAQTRYDWFYLRNPQGRARLNLLFSPEGSLAGSLGIGCREVHVGNERVLGGVLIDFVVAPRH